MPDWVKANADPEPVIAYKYSGKKITDKDEAKSLLDKVELKDKNQYDEMIEERDKSMG